MNAKNETHKFFVHGHFLNRPPLITYLLIPRGLAVYVDCLFPSLFSFLISHISGGVGERGLMPPQPYLTRALLDINQQHCLAKIIVPIIP